MAETNAMARNVPATKIRFNAESNEGELKTGLRKLSVSVDSMRTANTSIGIALNLCIPVNFFKNFTESRHIKYNELCCKPF